MEPIDTRSLQKNTKTNSIEISSQKKIDKASALSITFFTYELSFLSTFKNLQIIENLLRF